MGLWTWAEITAGIVISCLPVVPRFFQYFGPKFYKSLSFGSSSGIESARSGIESARKAGSTEINKTIEVSIHCNQRSEECNGGNGGSKPWLDTSDLRAQQAGEYIELDEFDAVLSDTDTKEMRPKVPAKDMAMTRKDLETGHCTPQHRVGQ